jgi:O-antigen/teichoic acid export membrane protein
MPPMSKKVQCDKMDRLTFLERIYRFPFLQGRALKSGKVGTYLVKGATGTFVLRVCSTIVLFAVSVVLARLLGAAGYGAYANGRAWLRLLAVAATLGFPGLLVRQTAIYRAEASWGLFRGMLRFSNLVVMASSFVLMAGGALVGRLLLGSDDQATMLHTLWIALLALPFVAIIQLQEATICGYGRIILGQLPGTLFRPTLFLVTVGAAYLVFDLDLTAPLVMFLQVLVVVATVVLGTYWLWKLISTTAVQSAVQYRPGEWLSTALPLLFVTGMYVVTGRSGLVMLAAMKGAEEAGVYRAVLSGAELILFPMFAVSKPFQPLVAALYAKGEKDQLQRIVTKWTRMAFLISVPLALGFIGWGDTFLKVFGPDFSKGHGALSILSTGRIICVGSGMVALLLNMSGHQRESAIGFGAGAFLNIIFGILLIPHLGTVGAAAAESSSMIFISLFLVYRVRKRMGIHATVLGRMDVGKSTAP